MFDHIRYTQQDIDEYFDGDIKNRIRVTTEWMNEWANGANERNQ